MSANSPTTQVREKRPYNAAIRVPASVGTGLEPPHNNRMNAEQGINPCLVIAALYGRSAPWDIRQTCAGAGASERRLLMSVKNSRESQ